MDANIVESTAGMTGIEKMLAENPNSQVTPEQLAAIDAHQSGSSELLAHDAAEETIKSLESVCPHPIWKRGMLPGGVYIKSCGCGMFVKISYEEWSTISDR
jgi:hypothetical protein